MQGGKVRRACTVALQESASASGAERVGAGDGPNRSCCYFRASQTSGVKYQRGA